MRVIGPSHPCLIVADGTEPEQAAEAGADAVIDADPGEARNRGLLLGVRVDADEEPLAGDADFLLLGDGEITNRPFIEMCARLGLPTLMGTGGSTLKEVTRAVGWFQLAFRHGDIETPSRARLAIEGGGKLVLLHGTLLDPSHEHDQNLRAMQRMHEQSFIPVGYEDRTGSDEVAALAVAAGAVAIVRRYGDLFPGVVRRVRRAESVLGEARKQVLPGEVEPASRLRRRIVAAANLAQGHVLTRHDVGFEAPAPGENEFAPHHVDAVLGRELQRGLTAGQAITSDDLGGGVPEPPPWFSPRPPKNKPEG